MKTLYDSITQFDRCEIDESIMQSRYTRSKIDESILSTDKEVQTEITKMTIYEQIKNILFEMYGSLTDPKSYRKWTYRKTNRGEDTYAIIFQYNLIHGIFSDTFKQLIKRLNNINDIDINWHIINTKKIFKFETGNHEMFEVEIFLDDEKILKFWVDDMYVNYKTPVAGLGLSFIFKSEYKNFVDLFKGEIIR